MSNRWGPGDRHAARPRRPLALCLPWLQGSLQTHAPDRIPFSFNCVPVPIKPIDLDARQPLPTLPSNPTLANPTCICPLETLSRHRRFSDLMATVGASAIACSSSPVEATRGVSYCGLRCHGCVHATSRGVWERFLPLPTLPCDINRHPSPSPRLSKRSHVLAPSLDRSLASPQAASLACIGGRAW